jgi:tRNA A37 methylthiotransferase MiaB
VKEILVEDVGPESLKGRTDTNHIVHLHENVVASPGDFIAAEIYHAGQHSLKGKIV